MSYKIGVITSTNRKSRSSKNVAEWFISEATKVSDNLEFDLVDIADIPFFNEESIPAASKYEDESSIEWSEKIKKYDGYVIVTAEYNHSFTAPIKNALDTLFHEWSRKPAGFVGYGSYGAESAIMALRPVVSYLNMSPIRETVRITKSYEAFDDAGRPKDGYVLGQIDKFVAELEWWTTALAEGRAKG